MVEGWSDNVANEAAGRSRLEIAISYAVSRRTRRSFKRIRWRATSALSIDRYTWAALNGLDRKLVSLFDNTRNGTFIELGANDGLQQSNTLALAQKFGWTGILIEADPQLAGECRRNRPDSTVVCAAAGPARGISRLVAEDLVGSIVANATTEHVAVLVPCVPLSEILDASGTGPRLDLLSVDVEGYEMEVLAGLDRTRHRPTHILMETSQPAEVADVLGSDYRWAHTWSHHDHLFSRNR